MRPGIAAADACMRAPRPETALSPRDMQDRLRILSCIASVRRATSVAREYLAAPGPRHAPRTGPSASDDACQPRLRKQARRKATQPMHAASNESSATLVG